MNNNGDTCLTTRRLLTSAASCAALMLIGSGAAAQSTASANQEAAASVDADDIIVTARKRQEPLLDTPVVMNAVSAIQIERRQVLNVKDIAALTPGVTMGDAFLSLGTQVSIRGVTSSSSDPGIDPPVAIIVDGAQLPSGLAFQVGAFDLARVEILKGPQALFYGKSSPGGLVSLTTADPTDRVELIANAAYEVEAREKRGEFILSGPLSETFGLRFAGMYNDSDGFFKNQNTPVLPNTGGILSKSKRAYGVKGYIMRGTAVFKPSDVFDARLKANIQHDRSDYMGTSQLVYCPEGTASLRPNPFIAGDACKADRLVGLVDLDPAVWPDFMHGTKPGNRKTQKFGTLEWNLHPSDSLTLTSLTGYYRLRNYAIFELGSPTSSGPVFGLENLYHRRSVTEEIRLASDFSGPLNFTMGGFYEDGRASQFAFNRPNRLFAAGTAYNLPIPAISMRGTNVINIETKSAFGQVRFKPVGTVEIDAGVRYSRESRDMNSVNNITGTPVPVTIATPSISSGTWSPELTISYKPDADTTIFGSLKRGYKSGSFGIASIPTTNAVTSVGDERVDGGEIGLKARLMDRQLTFNTAGYYYIYKGLQVGVGTVINNIPIARVLNAGKAKVYGLEFDTTFRPASLSGLSLRAAGNWNHGRFTELEGVPCYGGQTVAMGCNQLFNPSTGRFTGQSLSGTPLVRAPDWTFTFGGDYEMSVSDKLDLVFSNSNQYSSKYLAGLQTETGYTQKGYFKIDLSASLKSKDDRWSVALIGKNLGNVFTYAGCNNTNAAQGSFPTGQATGAAAPIANTGGLDEVNCFVERGRAIWLKLTLRPFN